MQKELNITPPEGWEIDLDKSDLTKNKIIYKEKETVLPSTWEEAIKKCSTGYYINTNSKVIETDDCECANAYKNMCYLESTAEELLALTQVLFLRDIYRQGWIPDYISSNWKHAIFIEKYKKIKVTTSMDVNYILSFQTPEIRDLFLTNFKDLIEKCKNLI